MVDRIAGTDTLLLTVDDLQFEFRKADDYADVNIALFETLFSNMSNSDLYKVIDLLLEYKDKIKLVESVDELAGTEECISIVEEFKKEMSDYINTFILFRYTMYTEYLKSLAKEFILSYIAFQLFDIYKHDSLLYVLNLNNNIGKSIMSEVFTINKVYDISISNSIYKDICKKLLYGHDQFMYMELSDMIKLVKKDKIFNDCMSTDFDNFVAQIMGEDYFDTLMIH